MELPFSAAEKAFEASHPGVSVDVVLDNANVLVRRILDKGEQTDLIVSPGEVEMGKLAAAGAVSTTDVHPFGRYELVLFTSRDNPAGIGTFEDLTGDAVKTLAIADPEENSVGRYTREALRELGLWDSVQSKLQFTDHPITAYKYVAREKAEASFAYRSCPLKTAPEKLEYSKVRIVKSVPKEIYGPAYAVIGILSGTAKRPLAQSFVDFLLSAEGQTLLKEHDVPILARVDAFVPCGMLSAFLDIKRQYEQLHPGVTVNLTFDRADALTSRILEDGDRPDVHFSIGQVEADLLVRGNAVKERTAVPFGRFDMALCVNETKQGVVRGLEDLTKPEVGRIVLTPAENSSVGHYARETLERAGLWQAVEGKVSYLPTIKDCYSELAGGRADAGFAYIGCPVPIDPEKAEYSKVKPVMTVPADLYGSATVYASVLSGAIHAEEARRFVAFLASPSSRASLARIGLQALDGEGFSAAQTSRQ